MHRGQRVNRNSSIELKTLSDDQLTLTGDQLKCVLINARSLNNKLPDLYQLLYSCDVDCVFVTETWLNNDITDGLLDPDSKYEVMRNDRLQMSGGGVCAVVKKGLHTRQIGIKNRHESVELLCCDIFGASTVCRFFVVYRPPDSSHVYNNISCYDYISNVVDCIERHSNPKGPTMVVGDFNCPDIVWGGCSVPCNRTSFQLYDFAVTNGFVQVVGESTRGNSLVDLVMTNQPFRVLTANVEQPFGSSDHNSISFSVAFERMVLLVLMVQVWYYRRCSTSLSVEEGQL